MRYMLIGNPNVGKTTLFNNLTGSNAHVGNWSGITVDKLEGSIKKTDDVLIDLPGTYSVTPSSEDEGVVTFAILNEDYNGFLNIVDATHLKRNLHLTIQLLEAGVPMTIAIQILEGNEGIFSHLSLSHADEIRQVVAKTEQIIIEKEIALSLKGAIFNKRREFIYKVYQESMEVIPGFQPDVKPKLTSVDRILTHPIWGAIIFFIFMLLIYSITFDLVGNRISDGFDGVLNDWIIPQIENLLVMLGASPDGFIYGAIIDGLVAGVGGVIIFLPQILILFFCLSLMEATGYMARVAIVMDYIFSRFGLNGKAIVPLVTGFGCNVPAIMATRTIPDRSERIKTMMIIPFMSCSARLPVYVLFVGMFFSRFQSLIIMALYLLGIIIALLSAKLLSVSMFKKTETNFILEIPPYRVPQFKNLLNQTLNRGSDFLHTAGKFIILGSIIMWILNEMGPAGLHVSGDESYLAILGGVLAPLFLPLGFGTWQAASSLVVGFLAKELVASSMLIICGGEAGLMNLFTPLQAFSFLVFSLLYIPCLSTVGVMYQETKSAKTTMMMVGFGLIVAYVVTFVFYQIGHFIF